MNSFLLFLGSLVVLALSALFVAPYFVDWNDYRDVFEQQASKLIGRQVDVGGDVSLTLLPAPVVRFETINVADADGKFETPFAAARSFTVWLSVPPLLRGTIEARAVEIDQPVINLRIADDGSGNWSNIGGEAADLPFIPKEVALNSVEVSGATINFWRGGSEPAAAIDGLDGELNARSLQGPFKFIGNYSQDGKRRDVRFSTGRKEENGEFRLNASVRSPEVKETYAIDGSVRGIGAVPVFKGKFRARLADDAPVTDGEADKQQAAAPFEIKSELLAGLIGAQFTEVELTVTKNNKPQTVSGRLDLNYQKEFIVGGTFSSRWVDLDSWVTSADDKPKLNTAVAALASEVLRRGLGVEKGVFKLFLDQAVVAGDLATNVQIELSAEKGAIELSRLSARLPGNARFRLSGSLKGTAEEPVFKGPVSLQGRTLSRLLRWAGMTAAPDAAKQSGAFTLAGTLVAGPQQITLEQFEGSLLDSAFSGAFSYLSGEQSAISLALKSDRMDLAKVLGSGASARSLWALLGNGTESQGENATAASGGPGWLGTTRIDADVGIGAVSFAGLGESSLNAKLTLNDGALDIRKLDLSSKSNVKINAGGQLSELGGKPKGSLTLAMNAADAQGLAALARFLEIPQIAERSPEQLAPLAPLQLTSAIRSVQSENPGLEVQLEGALGGSNVSVKLDLQGSPASWRTSQIAVNGSMTNKSGLDLLQQLQPKLDISDPAVFVGGGGTISLEASGIPETGLAAKSALKAAGTDWTTQGTLIWADTGQSFSGTTQMTAPNTAAGLSLFGIQVAPGHRSHAASIGANVESSAGTYRFTDIKGDLGGARFNGEATVSTLKDRPSISAQIAANAASLPQLLAPLVAWKPEGQTQQTIRGVSGTGNYWPDIPFSSSQLTRADGSISLTAERLRLTGALVVEKAKLQAKLSGGALRISNLEGGLFGGSFKADGSLGARGEGVSLEAKVNGSGLQLAQMAIGSGGKPLINAPANVNLSVRGVGLTPAGLAAGLSGQGEIDVGDGKINGFSLGAAHAAAVSAQREKGKLDENALGRRVAESMKNQKMSFSQIKAPFSIRNGIVEFEKVALSDAEGRVTVASYLQLANLQLDSEWALQSADSVSSGAKPRVSLVFAGSVGDIGKLRPKIDTANLARYVTIQKMQRDVERLEKLDVSPGASNAAPQPAPVAQPPQPPKVKEAARTPPAQVQPKPAPAPRPKPQPGASRPPPVQPVIPQATPPSSPATPPVAATQPRAPVAAVPPAPAQAAPLPNRKPPAPRPATAVGRPPAATPNTAARRPTAPVPRPGIPAQPSSTQPYSEAVPQPLPNEGLPPRPAQNLPWRPPAGPYSEPGPTQIPGYQPQPFQQPQPNVATGDQFQQPPPVTQPPPRQRAPRFDPFSDSGN
ncbi:MAG: AsmA family protein [Hyphomicrobiaceae bacterium]|nr:AsmA family protein [Hyphomicrobiaceae bacterium]